MLSGSETTFCIRRIIFRCIIAWLIFIFGNCSPLYSSDNNFPYTLRKQDLYLTAFSVATFISGEYVKARMEYDLSIEEIEQLNRNDINGFDRHATYYWNTGLNRTSDVFMYSLMALPSAMLIPPIRNREWEEISSLGLMYLQTLTLTRGIANHTKSYSGRIRPYLYNTSLTADERHGFQGNEAHHASTSFFSGHTAVSFASAVFLSKIYTDIYGKNTWSYVIWGSSLTVASVVAFCRVGSGEHFTSDVLTGALVGSAIGYLIPTIHRKKTENTSFSITPESFYLAVSF
jgi:membrane-associated phospholipid phosphatase